VPSLSVQLQLIASLIISRFQMYVSLTKCPVVNGRTFRVVFRVFVLL